MIDPDTLDTATVKDYEELYIANYSELYPTFNWSYGSFLYEMVIRPAAVLAASQEQDLDTLRRNFSLAAAAAQDTPDEDLVESLASNFRITPKDGTPGYGELAVYTRQNANVYIRAGSLFDTGGIQLTVDKTYIGVFDTTVYESTEDTEYRTMTRVGDEYVFIIPVRTVENTDQSVSEGQAVTMENKPSQVTRVEVSSAVSGGSVDETSAELVARAQTGVTAKVPSGNSHLNALFTEQSNTNVFSQKSFGLRDPECLRDRNNIFGISMGGRVDSYCKTAQLPSTYVVTVDATNIFGDYWEANLTAAESRGFYYIERIINADNAHVVTNQEEMVVTFRHEEPPAGGPEVWNAETARYSIYQAATVVFEYPGLTGDQQFTLYLKALPNLETLQEFINQDDIRNEANDVLIKAPVPSFVGISIQIIRPAGNTEVTEDTIKSLVADAVNAATIGQEAVTASTVVQAVEAAYPELEVDFPVVFESNTYLPDGSRLHQRECNGKITAPEDLEQGVTSRNGLFFCYADEISVLFRDETT